MPVSASTATWMWAQADRANRAYTQPTPQTSPSFEEAPASPGRLWWRQDLIFSLSDDDGPTTSAGMSAHDPKRTMSVIGS